jgi:hypothetical protein
MMRKQDPRGSCFFALSGAFQIEPNHKRALTASWFETRGVAALLTTRVRGPYPESLT